MRHLAQILKRVPLRRNRIRVRIVGRQRARQVQPTVLVETGISSASAYVAGHRLDRSVPDNLPPVLADPASIERVFVNLLENASKYSPPGSPIAVEARREGAEVVFMVADEGPGIPEDSLEIIFQRFTRLRDPRTGRAAGTGLGLALCKTLVEGHGGRIWAESERLKGSRFCFTLPVARRQRT
jgi:signal transduction histidine kinase